MSFLSWLGFAVGLVLVVLTAVSVLETTVVPRSSRSPFTSLTTAFANLPMAMVTARVGDYDRRDRLLAALAGGSLVLALAAWLILFLAGYALMLLPSSSDVGEAFRVAGSSMLTLGIAAPRDAGPTAVVFLAAVTGLVVIALQIAYLPVLYAAFNRRETLVTLLEALAGTPGWGPEILARSAIVDNLEGLVPVYDRWMEWSADVSESHTAYPVLNYFRSPTGSRSWVVSLLSVLDAAALHLALCPITAPPTARNLMRIGYLAFRQLARTLGHPVPRDPSPDDPIELSYGDYLQGVERMRRAGMEFERDPAAAWVHFKGWRVNYEAAAYALAADLDAVPALWSGQRVRPGPPLPPVAPLDRVSRSAEVEEIRRIGDLRRRRRAAATASARGRDPRAPADIDADATA